MTSKRAIQRKKPAGQLARYLGAPYVRMIIPNAEEGGYLAEVLELPGCITEGDTPEEAYRNLEDAMAGWITASLDTNRPIPDAVGDKEYSGHFPLRMSTELHRLGALRAMQEGISLNQWIAGAIAEKVAKESLAELADRVAAKVVEGISVEVFAGVRIQLPGVHLEAPTSSDFIEPKVRPDTIESTVATPEPVLVSWQGAYWDAMIAAIAGRKEVTQNA